MFDNFFKYGDGAKFLDNVVTNAEPLCIEFCSSVQCRILLLVKYLTFYLSFGSICPF